MNAPVEIEHLLAADGSIVRRLRDALPGLLGVYAFGSRVEYLAINPNGRIPAIVDRAENDLAVFESGAIMIYLAEKAGRLLPSDRAGRARVLQWLMFQMGGVGPMIGRLSQVIGRQPYQLSSGPAPEGATR